MDVPAPAAHCAVGGKRGAALPRPFACEPRRDARFRNAKNKKTRRGAGFWTIATISVRAATYPAGTSGNGRRAREVMPAAMRAQVRTTTLVKVKFMGSTLHEVFLQRNRFLKRRLDGYSAGVTLMRTRRRSPGS
jgi:hypothetical protein